MSPLPRRGEAPAASPERRTFQKKENQTDRPPITAEDAIKIILAKMKRGETTITQGNLENELDIPPKKASELMKELEENGIISAYERGKPRNILITDEPPSPEEPSSVEMPVETVESPTIRYVPTESLEPIPITNVPKPVVTTAPEDAPLTTTDQPVERKSFAIRPGNVPVRSDVLNIAHLPPPETPTEQETSAVPISLTDTKTPIPELTEINTELHRPQKTGRFDSIKATFRGAYERFISRFKGEVQPEDEKTYEKTWEDDAKKAATGLLNFVAKYTGLKLAVDLPPWFYQKFFTNPAERKRIKNALLNKERELDETSKPIALEQKKRRLEEAIYASESTFLTAENKVKLLQQLQDTVETYEKEDLSLRTERNEHIAKLLDEAIQARIENKHIFTGEMNLILTMTGLNFIRGIFLGATSLAERYKEVSKERKEGKRKGGQLNEWIVKGVTETLEKMGSGVPAIMKSGMYGSAALFEQVRTKTSSTTTRQRDLYLAKLKAEAPAVFRSIQGATTVLQAAGFTELAIGELFDEGGPSAITEASIKVFEQKGVGEAIKTNMMAPWERLGHGAQWIYDKTTGSHEIADISSPTPDTTPEPTLTPEPNASPVPTYLPKEVGGAGGAHELAVAAHDTLGSIEYPQSQIELGTVKFGNGIVEILERQGVSLEESLRATREAGIVRAGGDTRLTTAAIDHLSILAQPTPDGQTIIHFIDKNSGTELSLEDLHNKSLTWEHGTVPGEIATHAERIQTAREQLQPEKNAESELLESKGASHDFLNKRVKLFTNQDGKIISSDIDTNRLTPAETAQLKDLLEQQEVNPQELAQSVEFTTEETKRLAQEMVSLQALLTKLEEKGLGDSVEAQIVRNKLLEDQQTVKIMAPGVLNPDKLGVIENEKLRLQKDLLTNAVPEADRIETIRVRGLGKVEFHYDASGKPTLDWEKLVAQTGRSLEKQAGSLFIPGWEQTVRETELSILKGTLEENQRLIGGKLLLMHEALQELQSAKNENSTEAQYIREQMKAFLIKNGAVLNQDSALIKVMIEESGARDRMPVMVRPPVIVERALSSTLEEGVTDTNTPLEVFKSDVGKVKFVYKDDGSVQDAYIPAYTPKKETVEAALANWGLTKDQVEQHFLKRRGGLWEPSERGPGAYVGTHQSHLDTSARGMSERLINHAERLARQEATLVAMQNAGLEKSPEYQYWKKETAQFHKYVTKEMKPFTG